MKKAFIEGFCAMFEVFLVLYLLAIMCLCFILPAWLCATVSWWYVFTYTITIPIAVGIRSALSAMINYDENKEED